jgi:hypothetical protein
LKTTDILHGGRKRRYKAQGLVCEETKGGKERGRETGTEKGKEININFCISPFFPSVF